MSVLLTEAPVTAAAVYDVYFRFRAHFAALDQTKVLASVRTTFPNKKRSDYKLHAMKDIRHRRYVARESAALAYRYFAERQPDGYVSSFAKGTPDRPLCLPTEKEYESLEMIADYILAEDHARGLTILRDPYDMPDASEVFTPPGEGAVQFMRARMTEENAVARLLADFDSMKRTAYVNSDYAAIEYLTDVEAAVKAAEAPTVEKIAESLKAAGIEVNRRYVPITEDVNGKNIKVCVICDYPFEDRSPAKTAVVCGDSCRRRYRTLWQRVDRFGTTELEGERNRMSLEYPFLSPSELDGKDGISRRAEKPLGDSGKIGRMIAAKTRKERHGVRNTVKLVSIKEKSYTWTSDRNQYKFDLWREKGESGPVVTKQYRPEVIARYLRMKYGCRYCHTVHVSAYDGKGER